MASENEDKIIEVDARPRKAAMKKGVSFGDSQQVHALGSISGKVQTRL